MQRKMAVWALVLGLMLIPAAGLASDELKPPVSHTQSLFQAMVRLDLDSLAGARDKGADINATLGKAGLKAADLFGARISDLTKTNADLGGWPALTWAVFLGWEDGARVLIKSGAIVNAVDRNRTTALHWAAWAGNYPLAKTLLKNGANPNITDNLGLSPRDWAIRTGQVDVVRLLPEPKRLPDADGDGVPDHLDKCPDTPRGAAVDERGCWMGAYSDFFDFNQAVVKTKYHPYVKQAAEVIKAHPNLGVELVGHTDGIGGEEYNLSLGLKRAEAVRSLLIKFGVPANRLSVKSQGKTQPIADNATERGRAKNRRVEIRVWQPGMTAAQ
ncbi:MAG: OmpA family protein [Thermodesulfobacteriota bacterium]